MKIAFIGDQHGNNNNFFKLIDYVEKTHNPDCYYQAGDFGLMGDGFLARLDKISRLMKKLDKICYLIDGNHDNHAWLGAKISGKRTVELAPHVIYLRRGEVITLGGKNILGVGGALSVDRVYRKEGRDWWREETLSEFDYKYALEQVEGKQIDVMVAHDTTLFFDWPVSFNFISNIDDNLRGRAHRLKLQKIWEKCLPPLFIHGHYHKRYSEEKDYDGQLYRVEGLGRDTQPLERQVFIYETN